jgi:hypothetical protein
MTHLTGGVFTHLHRVDIVPPFGDEQEYGAQNDVANVGEEMIKVTKVNQQMVGIGASEIVIAHVLISRRHHHLHVVIVVKKRNNIFITFPYIFLNVSFIISK